MGPSSEADEADAVDEGDGENVGGETDEADGGDKVRATSPMKRKAPTTARNTASKEKKKKRANCKKGSRVKVRRDNLFHILKGEAQKTDIAKYGNSRNFYGVITSGNGKQGYQIKFDDLPAGNQEVYVRRRNIITVVEIGEEEVECDHSNADLSVIKRSTAKDKEAQAKCINDFCVKEEADILAATKFKMNYFKEYGDPETDFIEWDIVPDTESVDWDEVDLTGETEWRKKIAVDHKSNLNNIFFEHFFPCVTGHAKLIDEYHSSRNSPYYSTVKNDKIKFHDPDADDPDWKVKKAYTIMIAAVSEIETGVENLWKRGRSTGRKEYPNFGRYMKKNEFKAFQSAAAFCFAEKKYWYIDKRDRPWDIFLPCLQNYNERRQQLIKTILLMLDESMSGWRPKTSKLGGLPNYTFEPRKPVPLGTMFRNGVECRSGCIVFQDIVQNPEHQHTKKYQDEPSSLPDGSTIKAHTAEVLRQVEGANVAKGRWVGGDAWFGSVASAVEIMKNLQVHSTFIVKNNTNFFPMKILHKILQVRYGTRPAGHWVVMKTEISGIKILVLAYAWSQRGVSYMISTCGSTSVHADKYLSHFEDDFGNVTSKEINRPKVSHFLYEYLPLIDEHNKQRQNILNLERNWCTKDCWFRLLTTIVGMSVVDMHRWYRNMMNRTPSTNIHKHIDRDPEPNYELMVRKFSDMLCKDLEDRMRKQSGVREYRVLHNIDNTAMKLERIRGKDGSATRPATKKQLESGRTVGTAANSTCYVCRKYLSKDGKVVYTQTCWCCSICKMPLCKENRKDESIKRNQSCFEEHELGDDKNIVCGDYTVGQPFPEDEQVNLYPKKRPTRTRRKG